MALEEWASAWRIGGLHGQQAPDGSVARAAVPAVLAGSGGPAACGGGLSGEVETASPRRAYLHTGPESLYEDLGFVRDLQIAKWRWVMRRARLSTGRR